MRRSRSSQDYVINNYIVYQQRSTSPAVSSSLGFCIARSAASLLAPSATLPHWCTLPTSWRAGALALTQLTVAKRGLLECPRCPSPAVRTRQGRWGAHRPHPAVSPRAAPVLENSQRRPGHATRRRRSTVCICVGTVHPHVDARAGGVGGRLGVSVSWLASCGPGWAAIKQPEQDRCTTTNGTGGAQRTDGCRVGRRCGLAAREHGREWGEVAGGRPRPLSTRGTTLRQGRRGGSA